MKNFILLSVFLLTSALRMEAQRITGTLSQANGKAVEMATVLLLKAKDSSLVKGAVADFDGRFEMEGKIPNDRYFLSASLVGFQKVDTKVFEMNGRDYEAGKILMTVSAQELAGVTVTAKKPLIEVSAEKTILNIEGTINATGSTAMELLQKAPGVVVDQNDNISFKGKNGVKIYIDGRPSQMDNKSLADVLKSIPSDAIEAIEMIANPSAKYDAAGNAGIINIRLKKNKKLGFNGSLGAGVNVGISTKSNGSLNLNYRDAKWNLFSNYSMRDGFRYNELFFHREQSGNVYDQASYMKNYGTNHNFKLGADYYLDSRNTIGVLASGNITPNSLWENEATTKIGAIGGAKIDSILLASNRAVGSRSNVTLNVNYRFADTLGHEFNFDVDRGVFMSRSDSYQPNYYVLSDGKTVLNSNIYRNSTPTDIHINTVKGDYEQRLGGGKLGVGFKYSNVGTDNDFAFYNVRGNQDYLDTTRSDRFKYTENIAAAYLNYNKQLGKAVTLQVGLRMENTQSEGRLILMNKPDSVVSRNYADFFPSAALSWTVNKNNALNLTFSRRIDRPSYQDLNPFESKLDELTYQKGNPFLKPQYTNSVELTHTFMQFLNTGVGYSHTSVLFTEFLDTAATKGSTFVTNRNLSSMDNVHLTIASPLPITKWWNGYLNFTLFANTYHFDFNPNYKGDVTTTAFNLYSSQTFTLNKTTTLELSGWFNSPSVEGGWRSFSMGATDIGVQKKVLNGNGTIKVSYTDFLGTAGWHSINDFTKYFYFDGRGHWESQQVKVNFTYRFGGKEVKGARERKTGLEEEGGRIKG